MAAKNEVAQARLALANLINVDRFLEFEVKYDLSTFNPTDVNDDSIKTIVQEAYRDRPEMHKVKLSIEIAENNLKIQKAKFLPTLNLIYDYKLQSEEIDDTSGIKTWSILFSLTGPLFDGFATQTGLEIAKQKLISTELQETVQCDQIFSEVIQSLQSLKQSYDLIKSTRLNVNFMKERVYLTKLQYNNGKASTTDFISAQSSLDKALNGYYAQIMGYLSALAKLDYVLGNGK
jgi:outer membrane protein TolC